ncbi:hypothetical protein KUTeg_006808 [Tegillarca granosa]|uniref:hexokinase n=1 Tax=Tegillarca granosa TaxID=220873 RepID=A0ABQ9FBE1_TEGGR|nr:hypothetical protein KUTeg_006808 [Tegillarca granosa]
MDILSCLVLNDEAIQRIISTLEEQISYSNSKDETERKKSDLFWECTYVRGLLEGNENGNYLGLDLGSTNFRVVMVSFKDGKADTTTKYYNLPEHLLSGPADGVFDHIADSIEAFLKEEKLDKTVNIPLGFSFSFPTVQKSLKHSIMMTWTKSFKCTTGPGLDPVTLLEEAIKRKGGLSVPVDIIARISDTTGTLMAGNYMDKNCRIGLILGSGSNACFVERVENFNKLESDDGTSDKLFSGYFLGELVRLVLIKLTSQGLLFNGKETEELSRRWNFKTSYVTKIEKNDSDSIKEILHLLKLDSVATDEDISVVQETKIILTKNGSGQGSAFVAAVESILGEYILTEDRIQQIVNAFEQQATLANSKDETERKKSDLFWECTYVTKLLTGKENGEYLGLDLGGTNFRVVFDHIAESMEKFLKEENIQVNKPIPVGFTFSFPSVQKSLKNSILTTWTKCFKCTNGIGSDPCIMLEEAIQRRGGLSVPVNIITRLSTGSNACFVEHISNYKKLDTDDIDATQVLVNTEWGAFSDGGCLDFMKTDLDKELDQHSNHVGSFTFEKLFSGLYLGELVRLVLAKLTKEGLLFKGTGSPQLFQRFNFDTKYVTAIESDEGSSDTNTRHILKQLGLEGVSSDEDIMLVREVCEIISQRGAFCIAAATAVLLRHVNKPEVTIAVDGSLFEHHPKYKKHMSDLLEKLVPETKVKFILVKDGSGSGAAFNLNIYQYSFVFVYTMNYDLNSLIMKCLREAALILFMHKSYLRIQSITISGYNEMSTFLSEYLCILNIDEL